jgi:hypothetical protein
VEAEIATVDPAKADRAKIIRAKTGHQRPDRCHRIIGHADRSSEHVGGAARQHTERRTRPGNPGGDLVQGAIAAKCDHRIEFSSGRVLGETDGVPAAIRLNHIDVVGTTQLTVNGHRVARRHR